MLPYVSAVGCRPATTVACHRRRRVHWFCCLLVLLAVNAFVSSLSLVKFVLLWSLGGVLGSVKFVFTEVFLREGPWFLWASFKAGYNLYSALMPRLYLLPSCPAR